jgi:hypothetical protein
MGMMGVGVWRCSDREIAAGGGRPEEGGGRVDTAASGTLRSKRASRI